MADAAANDLLKVDKSKRINDVKPVATVRQGPVPGLSGSQTAFVVPGSIRQMRDAPFGKGKPFSSETYQAPSGPIATAVGTASTSTGVPGGGPGNGRPSGHGANSGLRRATSLIDLAFGRDGTMYLLEIAKESLLDVEIFGGPPIGALWAVKGGTKTELAAGELLFPGGVDVAPNGSLYVTTGSVFGPGAGTVVRVKP